MSAALLKLMWDPWNDVFRKTLGQAERSLVSELRDVRNKWAHQRAILQRRCLPRARLGGRLLTAVSAPQADEIEKMKMELLRVRFDEQVRGEKRKSAGTAIESAGHGQSQALARGGDSAQGCGQRPLPAGRVCRRSLAGASRRRHGRIPEAGGVLPPHLSYGEPEADAGRRGAAPGGRGRRSGGPAADQLRRRQDALDAGAVSPVFRHGTRASWPGSMP